MIESRIKKIINNGESRKVEFKLKINSGLGKSICGFANTNGGIVLIGVNDGGKIIGISKKHEREIANMAHTCKPSVYPKIEAVEIEEKNIFIAEIKKSDSLHSFKNIAYKRIASHNKPLSPEEVIEFAKDIGKIKWDGQVCEEAGLDDIDEEKIGWYLEQRENARKVSKKVKISTNKLLQNIKALKNSKPTNAGILFFGKYPQKFFPNARLRIVRFKGNEIINPTLDTANCEGTVWEMIETAEDFVRKNIRLLGTRTEKSFKREDKFEYPIKAVREAIINALIHRNYFETGDVRVFIFDNRIEIISPGTFPKGVSPKNPKHKPVNEILCQLTYDIGFIEKYGSGIKMMENLSKEWGNKEPYYDLHPIESKIIFESQIKESTYIKEDILKELNERQKKAIEYLKEKGKITNEEYQKINNTTRITAFRDLKHLADKRIIEMVGKTGKYTYYIAWKR
ncbi:MAG: putative DNA binding domain-containing protein [candidate division Zixibacteria bacterium]|nr:putative DNA binding domain-containing protein [candidate division Zixibacteria bacterium]